MTPVIADYPILAENKLDYIAGNTYTVEAHDLGQSGRKQIQHRLEGQNLVRDLIREGSAAFACVVVAAECAYRHIEMADAADLNWSEQTVSCEQSLALQTDEYAAPVVFQAFVVTTSQIDAICLSEQHGVSQLWREADILIPSAAKIALGPYFASQPTLQSILKIQLAEEGELPEGCFEVFAVPESGFYFSVKVDPILFKSLQEPKGATAHRDSIFCFALAQGLELLHGDREYRDGWKNYQHLRALHQELKRREAPTWDEEEFRANRAVALLKPHVIEPFDPNDSILE